MIHVSTHFDYNSANKLAVSRNVQEDQWVPYGS